MRTLDLNSPDADDTNSHGDCVFCFKQRLVHKPSPLCKYCLQAYTHYFQYLQITPWSGQLRSTLPRRSPRLLPQEGSPNTLPLLALTHIMIRQSRRTSNNLKQTKLTHQPILKSQQFQQHSSLPMMTPPYRPTVGKSPLTDFPLTTTPE